MDKQFILGLAALIVTLLGGFAAVMHRLGAIQFKIELLWEWYLRTTQHDEDERRRQLACRPSRSRGE